MFKLIEKKLEFSGDWMSANFFSLNSVSLLPESSRDGSDKIRSLGT